MRLVSLHNTSNESIKLSLQNGTTITLPPDVKVANVDVAEVDSLRGKIEFKEDLTEVNAKTGKTRILG